MFKKLLGLLALVAMSHTASAEVHVEASQLLIKEAAQIDPGTYSYYDMTLTSGEELVVDIQVTGGLNNSLTIWLLDLANFQRYNAGQQYNYIKSGSGSISGSTAYRFVAPDANIYYLVLDNTNAAIAARTVRTSAYKTIEGENEQSKTIKGYYSGLYNDFLKHLFVFDDFDIYVGKCGTENAFSSPHIVICSELNDMLFDRNVPEATMFVFLHEAAHSLLNVWDYPLYDNEDAADELATVLLLLSEQKVAALAAAKWWANEGSSAEALSALWQDDRHTISPQRARNIVAWVNNEDELKRRWLHLLMPKMTDDAVQAIAEENFGDVNRDVVTQELARRQALLRR